jgi:hypothetical protein
MYRSPDTSTTTLSIVPPLNVNDASYVGVTGDALASYHANPAADEVEVAQLGRDLAGIDRLGVDVEDQLTGEVRQLWISARGALGNFGGQHMILGEKT